MYQIYTHPKYREHGKKFFDSVNERYTEYAKSLEGKLEIPYEKLTPLIFILIRACVNYALFENEFYLKSQIEVLKETLELFIIRYNLNINFWEEYSMKKRILSILLTFCMVLMLVPKAVFAANDDLQSLLDSGDDTAVTLSRDYTIDTTLDVTGKTVTLDLNGHTISMTGSGSVIYVGSGGNLTVTDSNPTATHTDASLPAGGVITGGNATYGGGVYVYYGIFTMTGGTITNCSASNDGGGVYVGSSFTMEGGTITNCSASSGGGVYVYYGTFTMNGGTIEHCSASSYDGGGVFNSGDFLMSDGAIANCSASHGGGVYVYSNDTFTMKGGIIEACTSTDENSDAVYLQNNASLLANGGTIKGTVWNCWGTIQKTSANGYTVFYDAVKNYGTISGGIYYGGIQNSESEGAVTDTYYTVSFDLNGGSGTVPPTQYFVNVSTAQALKPTTEPTKEGYNTFAGWYNGDTKYEFTETVTDYITLTAKYENPLTYHITYNLDGGTAANNPATYTVESDAITLEQPEKTGYIFTGWSGTGLSSNNKTVTIPKGSTGDRTYTANWSDASAPVISGVENGKTYCEAQTVTVTEEYIESVKVNGTAVTLDEENQFTLNPAKGTQTIVVTDKAGNETSVTVTVNYGHTWNDGVCSKCSYICNHNDTDKDHFCNICGKALSQHSGGTATCISKAICDYCGEEYGEIDSTNHNLEKISATDATVTTTGNKEYWYCKDCKKYFSDVAGINEIKLDDTVIQKLPPEIIDGKGQSLTAGEKKELTFKSNAAFSDFIRIELDGKTLDENNYTVKEGSTVVTLKADYVATLSAGEHTIGIVSTNGTATTTFTVSAKSVVDNYTKFPQTGDNSYMALWFALLFVSSAVVIGTTVYGKKKRVK